jgi:amidase
MTQILYNSLQKQIQALRKGEISSLELIQVHLEHRQKTDSYINALVQVAEERALAEAQAADEAFSRGEDKGILQGIPVTVKDSWETEGIVSTSGTLGRKNYIPQRDATIVRRLRDAGAIILGKTNCSELVMPFETDNLVYGRTNNPWNLHHTPGGSTGGEAALIAAGGSPLGLAGDAGGSIRLPAHFCGISGIKPTPGRVPRTGHFPMLGGITGAMASAGPMARTIDDLMLVLPLLCGVDGIDAGCVPMPYYDPQQVEIDKLRIAFYVDNGIMAADDDTAQAVQSAAKTLEKAGAIITETCHTDIDSMLDIFNSLFSADGGIRLRQFLQRIGTEKISTALKQLLEQQAKSVLSTAEFMSVLGRVDKFRSQMLAFMQDYDAIICPIAAHPAPLHTTLLGEDSQRRLSYTITYNLVAYPSASVPVALSSQGLPIGVQVVAGAWREDIVLAVAKVIEQNTPGYQKPPMDWLS